MTSTGSAAVRKARIRSVGGARVAVARDAQALESERRAGAVEQQPLAAGGVGALDGRRRPG